VARAFEQGRLGIDKVVELTRFATPETERGLIGWAYERVGRHQAPGRPRAPPPGERAARSRARRVRALVLLTPTAPGWSSRQSCLPIKARSSRPRSVGWPRRSRPPLKSAITPIQQKHEGPMPWSWSAPGRIASDPDPDRATWCSTVQQRPPHRVLVVPGWAHRPRQPGARLRFHHRLVHEGGWRLSLHADVTERWLRPSGVRYRAGPAPPGGEHVAGIDLTTPFVNAPLSFLGRGVRRGRRDAP